MYEIGRMFCGQWALLLEGDEAHFPTHFLPLTQKGLFPLPLCPFPFVLLPFRQLLNGTGDGLFCCLLIVVVDSFSLPFHPAISLLSPYLLPSIFAVFAHSTGCARAADSIPAG